MPRKGDFNSIEKLSMKVDKTLLSGCWVWTGRLSYKGYGQTTFKSKSVGAHRFFYESLIGPIPEGMQIDHLCRNRACVNPDHMEPVTNRENQMRGISFSAVNAKKTHCSRGHEFTGYNLYTIPGKPGRFCRKCGRLRYKAYYDRTKAKV